MRTAYLVACINYRTNALVGVSIFSEAHPTIEGTLLTAVITSIQGIDYEDACARLLKIAAEYYPTLTIRR